MIVELMEWDQTTLTNGVICVRHRQQDLIGKGSRPRNPTRVSGNGLNLRYAFRDMVEEGYLARTSKAGEATEMRKSESTHAGPDEVPRSSGFVHRRRRAIVAVTLLVLTGGSIALFTHDAALAPEMADGIYSNDCCGTVELRDGILIANGAELVSYSAQRDEQGPYVIPRTFVGTQDRGIVLDGSRPVLKLRLDRLPSPTRIVLPGLWGPDTFVRTERRVR